MTAENLSVIVQSQTHTKDKEDKRPGSSVSNDGSCYPGQENEGRYGWSPDWIQCCNNPFGFLVISSFFLISQGMLVNGIFNVIITTLETRFRLQSSQTGLIAVSYDIGYWTVCLFVTFYANRGHRPRILGIGSIVLAVGCIMFAIPHFTTGLYEYDDEISQFCSSEKNITCGESDDDENLQNYRFVFIFSMLLQGIGCVPLYTLTYAFLEDSLAKGHAAAYISAANAMSILGPVIGYILGGYLLSIYVDFDVLDPSDVDITTSDPRWVGAWWVGHLLTAAMLFVLVTIPMFGFPKKLPATTDVEGSCGYCGPSTVLGTARVQAQRLSEVHSKAGAEITGRSGFGKSIRDMPIAILTMLKNPTYLFTTLGSCTEAFVIAGFTAFLPKVIENQYSQTPAMAALYAGVIAIPGGIIGNVLSGIMAGKFKLKTPQLLKICIACVLGVFVLSPIGLYHCPDPVVSGVTVPYNDSKDTPPQSDLTSTCNSNCTCQEEFFSPVCGSDGIGYFSACHAGCPESKDGVYVDCQCIPGWPESNTTATAGLCSSSCNALGPFIAVFFVIVMISFTISTPGLLVIMRCVPDSQRSFAIGLQVFIMRSLGSIPGPIAFGSVFDTACILWQKDSCSGGKGSCLIYNSNDLAIGLLIIAMVCKAISALFFSLALYLYKLPKTENADNKLDACSSDNKAFESTEEDDLDQARNDCIPMAYQEATKL